MRKFLSAIALSLSLPTASFGAGAGDIPPPMIECGGSFSSFVGRMKDLAVSKGHDRATVDTFFASVQQDQRTLGADRAQGIFTTGFIEFSRKLISQYRIDTGRAKLSQYDSVFDTIERQFGVSRGVLVAFWAFETDFGAFQGDFNTLNSLMTLSHDCRRPGLFQPQVLAAIDLFEHGDFSPASTTGAWAGEIGMVQMLPMDIRDSGIDGDGNGHVDLKGSAPDALMSGANMLRKLGWRANEPWIQEVTLPQGFDYSKTGTDQKMSVSQWATLGVAPRSGSFTGAASLPASVLVPQGHGGPAFIAYPNFDVYFEWNQSFTYVMTAAYFATRLEGADIYNAGTPGPALSGAQMKALQQKLQAMGYDVGAVDGILGARTRAAVQREQARLGLIADAWPTVELLNRL
ncbi:lytic murein transglycosylase [Sinisalibacter aestuarii]|uniref:Lytic transglycosylase n=1 Tax=Sinisalibacter aestuarii TaxID=2949426 RepID=A0ABQ5LPP1_9RHOB|nr:lytic murein transglycosylase [Sinisalibacter aestuarii]GKY86918.1 lytic transglycosylase [Sinisalibacter aestuarii]